MRLSTLAAAAFAALVPAAQAALPFGTLEFVTPSATVLANQTIEIWVRFTLDPSSPPLEFSSNPLVGFAPEDLPAEAPSGYDTVSGQQVQGPIAFARYDAAYLNTYYGCSGTFTNVCSPSANYEFQFWTSSEPGRPSINFLDAYSLQPGQSAEYLFGNFVPTAGGAAPGTYVFYSSGLTLNVTGWDATDTISLSVTLPTLGDTCAGQQSGCAFTREVLAVPEPGTYALMALGLAAVGWRARRRG